MKINQIKNKEDLAGFLEIPLRELTCILYGKKTESYYEEFEIPKRTGGKRVIHAPRGPLKRILETLSKELYLQQELERNIGKIPHGFIKRRSIITNAQPHVNKRVIINVDIENFFGSINSGRIYGFLKKDNHFRLNNKAAGLLASLVTYKGVLPQGAPTSPIISNLVFSIVDKRILKIVKEYKLTYTRYADDLTFSTNRRQFLNEIDVFLSKLEKIITESGFSIKADKTRIVTNEKRQEVTGLVVNKKVNLTKEYFKYTRAMAHSYYKNRKFYIDGNEGTIQQLLGRFSYIGQISEYNINKDLEIKKTINDTKNRSNLYNKYSFEYLRFLMFIDLFDNEFPLVITEGKTDSRYLVSAIKHFLEKDPHAFPYLAEIHNGKLLLKIRFLSKVNKMSHLSLSNKGGHSLINIYRLYMNICYNNSSAGKKPAYSYFLSFGYLPRNPVFLLFDNESTNTKPLKKTINNHDFKENNPDAVDYKWPEVESVYNLKIEFDKEQIRSIDQNILEMINFPNTKKALYKTNLFITSFKRMNGSENTEIEDLFEDIGTIPGMQNRKLDKSGDKSGPEYISKNDFSVLVMKNYKSIDYSNFYGYLSLLNENIKKYREEFRITKSHLD